VDGERDAQYTFPLGGDWEGFARAEWYYRDDTYSDLTSVARRDEGFPFLVPSYDNTNLRAGVQSDRFSIVAYIENVFDQKYFTNVYEKAFVSGMALQPSYQTYGVRFTWRTNRMNSKQSQRTWVIAAAVVALASGLVACGKKEAAAPPPRRDLQPHRWRCNR
jgi:hypothetical protein